MSAGSLAWLPVLIAALTAAGGVGSYLLQKRADRRHQLIEMRRAAYRAYIDAFMDQISPENDTKTQVALQKREMDLFLVASDPVLAAVGSFSRYGVDTSRGSGKARDITQYKTLLSALLLAMRNDCFEKSQLSEKEALALLPMD